MTHIKQSGSATNISILNMQSSSKSKLYSGGGRTGTKKAAYRTEEGSQRDRDE